MGADICFVAESYARECFGARTAPRVDELAQRLGMHPSYLSRRFKASTGQLLSSVLKGYQIEEALRLLAQTAYGMDEIASRAGFGTRNTFFRFFKRAIGTTPQRYRASGCSPPANLAAADRAPYAGPAG